MGHDVIVVGGSYAGLAAAIHLGRARRNIVVVDSGLPRNRFSPAAHGLIGHDGRPPPQILGQVLGELERYPSVSVRQATAMHAEAIPGGFSVHLDNGRHLQGSRLLLAYGVRDTLPPLPGLRERWGQTVLHCPYCHGFELEQRPIGVLGGHDKAFHMGMLLPDWGPTTLFTQGMPALTGEQQAALAARGARVEDTPVVGLLGDAPSLSGVVLADGRTVPLSGLFVAPRLQPSSDIASQLGCAMDEHAFGQSIRVDALHAATVPGVFAAGDVVNPMGNVTLAAAAGIRAASAIHAAEVFGGG